MVRWFLDADNKPDSHQSIIITFWLIYNAAWNLHENSFRGICIKTTSKQTKIMLKQLISFAQAIKLCNISNSRGVSANPIPFASAPGCVQIMQKFTKLLLHHRTCGYKRKCRFIILYHERLKFKNILNQFAMFMFLMPPARMFPFADNFANSRL